ncbi:hypothetical protein CR513_09543, partial [Mucuna pruriens]
MGRVSAWLKGSRLWLPVVGCELGWTCNEGIGALVLFVKKDETFKFYVDYRVVKEGIGSRLPIRMCYVGHRAEMDSALTVGEDVIFGPGLLKKKGVFNLGGSRGTNLVFREGELLRPLVQYFRFSFDPTLGLPLGFLRAIINFLSFL